MKETVVGAEFSACRNYRYVLWRIWEVNKPKVMFIGLNPSTANEISDDPTIRRVKSMAQNWGFGGVYMCNLFAFISPYPEDLKSWADPVADNDKWLAKAATLSQEIVFAWGNFKEAQMRSKEVIALFPNAKALIINKDGSPRHPLYVPGNTSLIKFQQ